MNIALGGIHESNEIPQLYTRKLAMNENVLPACSGPALPTHLQDLSVLRRVGVPLGLADDLAGDAHAVEHGHVEHGGEGARVERLRAVRPKVGALGRVDVAGTERGLGMGKRSEVGSKWN